MHRKGVVTGRCFSADLAFACKRASWALISTMISLIAMATSTPPRDRHLVPRRPACGRRAARSPARKPPGMSLRNGRGRYPDATFPQAESSKSSPDSSPGARAETDAPGPGVRFGTSALPKSPERPGAREQYLRAPLPEPRQATPASQTNKARRETLTPADFRATCACTDPGEQDHERPSLRIPVGCQAHPGLNVSTDRRRRPPCFRERRGIYLATTPTPFVLPFFGAPGGARPCGAIKRPDLHPSKFVSV